MTPRLRPEASVSTLRRDRFGKPIFRVIVCIAAVLTTTALLFVIHVHPDRLLSAALNVFLIVVLTVSIRWGTGYAIFLSLLSALAFSWSLPAAGHFHLSDARVWTLLTACLVTGLVAGQLSGRARRETLSANQRRAEAVAAQELLRRSEAYLAEAQRLTHTGSWACNMATRQMLHSSDENTRLYGFDPSKGIPSFEDFGINIHPDDRGNSAFTTFENAIHSGKDYEIEFRIVLRDGTIRHLCTIGHPVTPGEVGEYVGITMDVTERKHSQEERERLRQLQSELAHMNRVSMMGELTASLAHEINQPIAAAVTNARTCVRWLRRDVPDLAEACDAASRMVSDATRVAQIVDRVRSLYKRGTAERELVDVNEIIREMIALLDSTANRHSISIRTELDPGLPAVTADRVQLQQVLMNLMLNGIEAMKDTSGELTVASKKTEDGQLMISVSDSGIGIDPNQADRVFEAFFTTKPHGTGMGLSISRKIIESHSGRLWASANSGRGATFCFTLPATIEVEPSLKAKSTYHSE